MKFICTLIMMILSMSLWAQIPVDTTANSQSAKRADLSKDSKVGSISASTSGSGSGTNHSGSTGAIFSEELEGEGKILVGGLCYNECKSKSTGLLGLGGKKEGLNRKDCVECLIKYPGVYRLKREFLPKDDNSVDLNGCVRNIKQSIECPEGTYKFDSSTIDSDRVGGKDIETQFGSDPIGGGKPSKRSGKTSQQ